MVQQNRYSRRSFLGVLAGSSAATAVSPYMAWLPARADASMAPTRFAYVASWKTQEHGIHVFGTAGKTWKQVQFVGCEAPSAFALSADQQTLFVANCRKQFNHLPTASVESYRIERSSGSLEFLSRAPLALSAVEPEHLAVSPDGKYLAVAATGGGSYNLLPIAEDGSLGAVAVLRKEIGCGPDPEFQSRARPGQLAFDAHGHLLTTDLGADRVSSFLPRQDSLELMQRNAARPGSGPSSLAMHASAGLLFVGNALDGTIRTHRYRSSNAGLGEGSLVSALHGNSGRLVGLALHPSGETLFSAWNSGAERGGVDAWQINVADASISHVHEMSLHSRVVAVSARPDGESLICLNESGTVTSVALKPCGRGFTSSRLVASVDHPRAVILTSI